MQNSLRTLLFCSALCAGLAATSASASESRTTGFSIPCNGQTQQVLFNTTGLGAGTRFVQGTEIAIIRNPNSLQFLALSGNSGTFPALLALGVGQRHASLDYQGFYPFSTVGGAVPFVLVGVCTGGGSVDGIAIIQFFS